MEAREILVANTRTQRRHRITTGAETLGELKTALQEADIDFTGMTFTEGISKTQLLSDETQLPRNVMYKGSPTNQLVILLTNTKKNIASGGDWDRTELYSIIKENSLQGSIREFFGDNYTHISTDDLKNYLEDKGYLNDEDDDTEDTDDNCDDDNCEDGDGFTFNEASVEALFVTFCTGLLATLYSHNVISSETLLEFAAAVNDIVDTVQPKVSTSDGKIQDADINDMINELKD